MSFPDRGRSGPMPPVEPLIYRLYEIVQNYGYAFKAVMNEKFGDGIMSAICFNTKVEKEVVGVFFLHCFGLGSSSHRGSFWGCWERGWLSCEGGPLLSTLPSPRIGLGETQLTCRAGRDWRALGGDHAQGEVVSSSGSFISFRGGCPLGSAVTAGLSSATVTSPLGVCGFIRLSMSLVAPFGRTPLCGSSVDTFGRLR
jgi:hypothetical protein